MQVRRCATPLDAVVLAKAPPRGFARSEDARRCARFWSAIREVAQPREAFERERVGLKTSREECRRVLWARVDRAAVLPRPIATSTRRMLFYSRIVTTVAVWTLKGKTVLNRLSMIRSKEHLTQTFLV